MLQYRFYCLDRLGHVVRGESVEALDDLAALELAQERCEDDTIEVWQGARRVAQVTRKTASAA